jgi:tetratricopeptide (TPR) repeat protein
MVTINLAVSLSLLLITAIVIIGIWQINRNPTIAFAILFFFVTTSIVSNIFIPTGVLIAERTIYLPTLSICLLISATLYHLHQIGWKKLSISTSIILLLLASIRTYERNFDFQSDFVLYSSVVKLAPKNIRAVYAIASHYQEIGEIAQAEAMYKKLLEDAPSYIPPYLSLGTLYFDQGFYEKAELFLTQAVRLNPLYSAPQVAMAKLYFHRKEYQKAVEAFQIAIKHTIPNARLHHVLAMALYEAGNLQQAELEIRKSIELDPYSIEPQIELGRILRKQGRIDEAKNYLDSLVLDSNNANFNSLYGVVLLDKGNLCEAKEYLLKSISINPQLFEAHFHLGLVYSQLRLYNEAQREFQTSLSLDPSNIEVKEKLLSINEKTSSLPAIQCPN